MTRRRWALLVALGGVLACDARGAQPGVDGALPADGGGPVASDGATSLDGALACAQQFDPSAQVAGSAALRFSEVMAANDGAHVDELGETDDWLELANTGSAALALRDYWLTDGAGNVQRLPDAELAPGQVVLLWADDDPSQGAHHLAFKLASEGERLTLWADPCTPIDRVDVPAVPVNESYARTPIGAAAFASCRFATPGRDNGATCTPPAPNALPEDATFAPFTWPERWPEAAQPLAINELALRPAAYVEVLNTSDRSVALSDYALALAPLAPGAPYPTTAPTTSLPWPTSTLGPGQRAIVMLTSTDTAALEASPAFYGVATLFGPAGVVDRVDFSDWPAASVLARAPEGSGSARFCTNGTPGAANACVPLPSRQLGDHASALQTEGDFARLARGGTAIGQAPVKFVIDMSGGDAVQLLSIERWALHYTFVRERIYREPPLDRCDPVQARTFDQGWYEFSVREYFRTVGRRFLLGTLIVHANGLQTVEFASGDVIDAPLMRRAFLAAVRRTPNPRAWSLRPTDARQVAEMRKLEGSLPIVGPNAPFADLTYQPLTSGEGFGVLQFVAASELAQATLSAHTIVVTDDVPNDVPLVGGLITEAFQTPLAHVNVLSQARGTPNMALRRARDDGRLKPLFGKLVRLEVGPQDFDVREATAAESDAFWQARRPAGPRVVPPSDTSVRGLLPLAERTLADLPAIGAKAAQFAELYRIAQPDARCQGPLPFRVPSAAFAVPVVHYAEHFAASGAAELLRGLLADPEFRADPEMRAQGLAAVQQAILRHPVAPALLAEVEAAIQTRFGTRRVRLRSSSNTEDLPDFNGAGLHTSVSAELGDAERAVQDGLRTVWASMWSLRAYDEREDANLEQTAAMMGVLVHEAFAGEAAQGVAISRNLLDVTRDDFYYVNAQIGEATVTNPAPGVATEQLLYGWPPSEPEIGYQTRSSLTNGAAVLSAPQVRTVACALGAVHQHFRPLLDPSAANRLFAMQIEFKFERSGQLVVKQARPQPFGHVTLPADCR